jgi:hypothetical protein
MSGRPLILATVMLLIGCLAAVRAQAENLDAGKSPSQIFAGTCSECHKSARGLLRKIPAASLPGFLREHYTTGGEMASVLSAYLLSNGAADRHLSGGQPKPGVDAKPDETKPADQAERRSRRLRLAEPAQEAAKPNAEPRQAARRDVDGPSPQLERRGRKRPARPAEAPEGGKPADDGQTPAQATSERGPDGRRSAARLRHGRPGDEALPKTDTAKTDTKIDTAKSDAAKSDAAKTDASRTDADKDEPSKGEPSSETARGENNSPEVSKPDGIGASGQGKSEAAKFDAPKATGDGEAPALRADPVPPVTPAPAAAPAQSAAASSAVPERALAPPPPATPSLPASVTASAPPPAATGPPLPPISQ